MPKRWPHRTPYPIEYYVKMLDQHRPWGMARYGDGEWLTILGHYGMHNSNGCTFTKRLGDALRQALRNQQDYQYGILRIAQRKIGREIEKFLKRAGLDIPWVNGDLFLDKSLKGLLFPLVRAMGPYRILYVGPKHCRRLNRIGFFDYKAFVQPPPRDAINDRDRIIREVKEAIEAHDINLIGWSSGLHTKAFLDDIWTWTEGSITQIDFGSLWDGYCGVKSRTYMRRGKNDFDRLRKLNLGLETIR